MTALSKQKIYNHNDEEKLQAIRNEHQSLSRQNPGFFKMPELFSDEVLNIVEYCKGFTRNPNASVSDPYVKNWAKSFGIWLEETGDNYNNMTAFLHSTHPLDKLNIIGYLCVILFYLNDSVGREKFDKLDESKKVDTTVLISRMLEFMRTYQLPDDARPIERAWAEAIFEVRKVSDPTWFKEFAFFAEKNLEYSFRDHNGRATGKVLSVEEYIDLRLHISGMYSVVSIFQFGENLFIDRNFVKSLGLEDILKRAEWLCAAIGALMNDVFSFEKEFIVDGSDFNLVVSYALNEPNLSLIEAVNKTASFVRELIKEYISLHDLILKKIESVDDEHVEAVKPIKSLLNCMEKSNQATYVWEIFTDRYLQKFSIFEENLKDRKKKKTTEN